MSSFWYRSMPGALRPWRDHATCAPMRHDKTSVKTPGAHVMKSLGWCKDAVGEDGRGSSACPLLIWIVVMLILVVAESRRVNEDGR
jgi:hypothetical protein